MINQQKVYIYVFEYYLFFAIFKPFLVTFTGLEQIHWIPHKRLGKKTSSWHLNVLV